MNKIARLLAVVSLLAVVAACGSESGDDDTAGQGTTSGTSEQPAADQSVVSVALRQSGGLKPVSVTRVFTADAAPPKGYSSADVDAAIAAAEAFTESGAEVTPMPQDTCCDRYEYDITITYADGSTTTVQTIDGLRQPPEVRALVSALS